MTPLRETYARDICQNPGVPLEDCPHRDEHYARADDVLGGLAEELYRIDLGALIFQYGPESPSLPYAIVAALEDRT